MVYENVYAGNPVFITYQAKLPEIMFQQPWMTVVDYDNSTQFSAGFKHFMDQVRHHSEIHGDILEFANKELMPYSIYLHICVHVGICKPSDLHSKHLLDALR